MLQESVRQMCLDLGLYHYHTHDSRRSNSGYPDSFIMNLRTGRHLWRELKTQAGQLSSMQKAVCYALTAGGADCATWRPADLLDGTIGAELARLAGYAAGTRDDPGPCTGHGCDHASHRARA
jgi:hypothetical protein